jgi:acetolactate synthase I/II/III large subunit
MPTCAEALAHTLRDAGITVMFGLPGGEILDFLEAARRAGIRFILTRREATASFMADVTGQIQRRPGVCVSTLGPGAINMTLGVANAFLDRSPVISITASLSTAAEPYATHQHLDLNAVYRPFTKMAITLDGRHTASTVRGAIAAALAPRMGPVHLALPSDVGRAEEQDVSGGNGAAASAPAVSPATAESIDRVAETIARAQRPVVILGLDLDPTTDVPAVRAFVEYLGAPVFVTPKAKGFLPEDHALFCGVCAGVAGDARIVEFLGTSDLLVGIGFEPVESDKLWHQSMPLVSIGPVTIASRAFAPQREAVGTVTETLDALCRRPWGPFAWAADVPKRFRTDLDRGLRPFERPTRGLSAYELTRTLRGLFPRDTILATDVGSIKSITTQAWTSYAPLTFFESNGLSAMSYGFPAAMAARLQFPNKPILCTIGDGGFGMTLAEIETCVRERLHFMTVVYNDSALSLIDVAQQNRGYQEYGVKYRSVDFAAAAAAFGAWSRRAETMEELDAAVREGLNVDRPVVIDAVVDPAEYTAHHPRAG